MIITICYKLYRMPVNFEEFDADDDNQRLHLREGSNAYRILEFLLAHPKQGFTPKEISERTSVPRGSVGTTLSRLEERDLVRHKEPYWAMGDDDRLAAYSAMLVGLDVAKDRFDNEDWGDWQETAVDPRRASENDV